MRRIYKRPVTETVESVAEHQLLKESTDEVFAKQRPVGTSGDEWETAEDDTPETLWP